MLLIRHTLYFCTLNIIKLNMLFHLNLHIYDHHCLLFTKSPRILALVHDGQRTLPDLGQELLHVLPGEGGVDGVLVAGHQVRQGDALLELTRAVEQKIFRPNWVKNISHTCSLSGPIDCRRSTGRCDHLQGGRSFSWPCPRG